MFTGTEICLDTGGHWSATILALSLCLGLLRAFQRSIVDDVRYFQPLAQAVAVSAFGASVAIFHAFGASLAIFMTHFLLNISAWLTPRFPSA